MSINRGPEFLISNAQIGYPLLFSDPSEGALSDFQIVFDPSTFNSPITGLDDIRNPKLDDACFGPCSDNVPFGNSLLAPKIQITKTDVVDFRLVVEYPEETNLDGSVEYLEIVNVDDTDADFVTDLGGGLRSYVFNVTYSGSPIYINVIVNSDILDSSTTFTESGLLAFRCVSFLEKNVTQIVFNSDSPVLTVNSGEILDFKFGTNTDIIHTGSSDFNTSGEVVDFSAIPGSGEGRVEPDCDEDSENPITSINGVVPDANGNINIEGSNCYTIGPIAASNTLYIDNNCEACLDCDDIVDRYNSLKTVNNEILALANRFDDVYQEYNDLVLETNKLVEDLSTASLSVNVLQTAANTYFVYFDFSVGDLAAAANNLLNTSANHSYRVVGFDIEVTSDTALPVDWNYNLVSRSGRVKVPLFPTQELTNVNVITQLKKPTTTPGNAFTGNASLINNAASSTLSTAISNINNTTSTLVYRYTTNVADNFFDSSWESFTRGGGNFTLELTAPASTVWPGGTIDLTFQVTNVSLRGVPNASLNDITATQHTGALFASSPASVDITLDNITSIPS